MKHHRIIWLAILLIAMMLVGCTPANSTPPATDAPDATVSPTEPPTQEPTEPPTETPAETTAPTDPEEDVVYEGDATSYYMDVVYPEQIDRYHTALAEKWNEDQYIENSMSEVLTAYYEGNPLNNVGFGFVDLDNDGRWELVIGAIQDAETEPAVFEIWTLVDNKPVMVAQADAKNQYALQYSEEDRAWYVAYESSHDVTSNGTYYLMLTEGKFEVMQGIVYHAEADNQNPWFMAYDLDWDISNDEPIDEDTANAIIETNRKLYTPLEFFPYILYK